LEGIFALYKEALVPTVQGKQDFCLITQYCFFVPRQDLLCDLLSLDKGLFTFKVFQKGTKIS